MRLGVGVDSLGGCVVDEMGSLVMFDGQLHESRRLRQISHHS